MDREDPYFVRFRAADWDEFPSSRAGTGWAPKSSALLLFQFRFYDAMPYLDLALSTAATGNAEIRALLFEAVKQNPEVFNPTSNSLVDGWIILHQEPEYILEPADYGPGWDDGTAQRKIEAWIDKFAAQQFPKMNRIILDWLERVCRLQSEPSRLRSVSMLVWTSDLRQRRPSARFQTLGPALTPTTLSETTRAQR